MKIAIGGMQKNEMDFAIKKAMPEVETVLTNDMAAVKMLKNGEVDYYFGACESGGGSAISILIGLMGYSKCCTVVAGIGCLPRVSVVQMPVLLFTVSQKQPC